MKDVVTHLILGLMSLLIGLQFIRMDNGYNPITGTYDGAPGYFLIFLGGAILIYYFLVYIFNVYTIIKKNK